MKTINDLKEDDLISILLYAIYKMSNDGEYSTLSELIYVLDRNTLYKLCSIFGGVTLKIPTLTELKIFIGALVVYQSMVEEGTSFNTAFNKTNLDISYKKEVFNIYNILTDIISNYNNE